MSQRAAIILAGGRSRRMGRPKAWLELDGRPLLELVAARVRPLVDEIVVVAAPGQTLPAVAARVVRDEVPHLGPLAAVAGGLAAITAPLAFALGCDAPFVRRKVLELLVALGDDADGVVPTWDARPQPLVALYHRRLVTSIDALVRRGERRLQAVTELPGVRLVPAAAVAAHDPEGTSFRTVNTPDEYRAAQRDWPRLACDP